MSESPSIGEAFLDALLRTLHGLATVGKAARSAAVETGTFVSRAVYPVKESCIKVYESMSPSNAAKRRGRAPETPAAVIELNDNESDSR